MEIITMIGNGERRRTHYEELSDDDFDRRISFCEEIMGICDNNPRFVNNIDFSGCVNRQNYRYWWQDNPQWMEELHKQYPQKVNVWAGIVGNIIIGPFFFEGSSCDVVISSDTNKNGTIMSPSYPSPYPAKTTCRYEFQGRGKERVQVTFQDFNLYHSMDHPKDCDNTDSLVAFVHIDGRMEKIDSFCGSVMPKPVMSNGPRLKLEFQSPIASRYSRGFKAAYSFTENFGIKTGTQLLDYPCAFVFNSNESRNGYFHSPNYPGFYPRDTECHYFFHGNLKEKVHLQFNYFDVEGVLPCEAISASDYVEFSNFMARDRKYSRHCGQLKEFDIESDRKFFRVTFRSNDRLDGTGFNATYHFLDEVETYTGKPMEKTSLSHRNNGANSLLLLFIILVAKLIT